MQAVVKTPHIEINIKRDIPKRLLSLLIEKYGESVLLSEDDDDEVVNIFQTDWYRNIRSKTTPARH